MKNMGMIDPTHEDGTLMMDESGNLTPMPPVYNPGAGYGIPPVKNPESGGQGFLHLLPDDSGGPMPPVKLPENGGGGMTITIPEDPTEAQKKKNLLLLVGVGVAAYFLFFDK